MANVHVNIDEVTSGLYKYANFTRARCRKYLKEECEELESYMKQNAPWNDRTGNARRGLKATYSEEDHGELTLLTIELSHSDDVPYGKYLEYGFTTPSGRFLQFPIVEPTARLKGAEVLRGMRGILNVLAWED